MLYAFLMFCSWRLKACSVLQLGNTLELTLELILSDAFVTENWDFYDFVYLVPIITW